MKRRRQSDLQRRRIFDTARGICAICELPIQIGQTWHIDHEKPLWLAGSDDPANMRPVHDDCHLKKTVTEATLRAKCDRVRAKHLGIKKTKHPFLTNRDGPYRKPIYGPVERRRK